MAKKIRKQSLRSIELAATKNDVNSIKSGLKVKIRIIIPITIVIFVIIGILIYNGQKVNSYNSYKVIHTNEFKNNTILADYVPYRSGYVRYNRDGAEAVGSDGILLWNMSYDMKDPIISVCNNYVAIGDRGSNLVYIADGTGNVKIIDALHTILDVEVANQGVVAIWTESQVDSYIFMYSIDGKMICEIEIKAAKDGFPLDIALSMDGTKLIVSYLKMDNDEMKNWVNFYNFDSVGENYVNNQVGAESYGESIAPAVRFLNNERMVVLLDNGFVLYKFKQLREELKKESFTDNIKSVAISDNYFGFLFEIAAGNHVLSVYNTSGAKVFEKEVKGDYGEFLISGNDIILYGSMACVIYHMNGTEKFKTIFDKNVRSIIPVDQKETYIFINDTTAETIQLVEKSTEE